MESKSLIYRCFIYFFISFIVLFFTINYFKEKSSETIFSSFKTQTLENYNKNYFELENIANFIYFNEFVKDRGIISLFKKDYTESLKNKLYDDFEKEFAYYKTLGLYDIGFFSSLGDTILNFQDVNFQDSFNLKIVNRVISTKKEQVDIKNIDKNNYIIFAKPIIDDRLDLVGVVSFEFNFNKILEKLNSNLGMDFEQVILADNENMDKDSIYISVYDLGEGKFLYIKSSSLEDSSELIKSNRFYLFLIIFSSLNIVLILSLIYQAKIQRYRKNLIQNSYDELFSQVDNYVLKLDTDLKGNITFVTNYFSKISGYSKDEVIGKNANILRHPDMSSAFYKNLWNDLQSIKIWQGEVKNRDKFGNTYWVRTTLFPIYNYNKKHIGYSSIRTDITATKQLEKTNRLLKEDLSSRLKDLSAKDEQNLSSTKVVLMSKILDSFSHQWKMPISKISFELQKLEKLESGNSFIRDIKNSIEDELKELSNMLNETKTLFSLRPNSGSKPFEIVKNIAETIDNSAIDIRNDIDENIELDIIGNELKSIIYNIFFTIIDLAKVYSMEKTIINVTLDLEDYESNEVVLKIEDNINDIRKKEFLDSILKFEDDKDFDAKLYLAKLLIDKNQAIFWCNISEDSTSYYIKFRKSGES